MADKISFAQIPDADVPREILATKDPTERIFWVGQPDNIFAYIISSGGSPPIAIAIGAIVLSLPSVSTLAIVFACVMLVPALIMLMNALNTRYAVSDRRVIIRTGWLNDYTRTVDYDQITEVVADASPIQRICEVGSVSFLATQSHEGHYRGMIAVSDYRQIAAMVKNLMVDVKTDWNYTNIRRQAK